MNTVEIYYNQRDKAWEKWRANHSDTPDPAGYSKYVFDAGWAAAHDAMLDRMLGRIAEAGINTVTRVKNERLDTIN